MDNQQQLLKFGATIRRLREANGWSQERLAEEADFHRTYIGSVERGEQNISLINILRFAETFKVQPKELLDKL